MQLKKKCTKERDLLICADTKTMSKSAVAEKYDISLNNVSRILKKRGFKNPYLENPKYKQKGTTRVVEKRNAKLKEMATTHTNRQLAEIFDITIQYVCRIIKRPNNVKRKQPDNSKFKAKIKLRDANICNDIKFMSREQIAEKYKINVNRVREILSKNGCLNKLPRKPVVRLAKDKAEPKKRELKVLPILVRDPNDYRTVSMHDNKNTVKIIKKTDTRTDEQIRKQFYHEKAIHFNSNNA